MPFIGQQPLTGAYSKLDSITTSATATYNLQLDGSAYSPASANHLLVSLNGVMQAPQDSFTVSGSTITFASALTSSDNIDFIMAMGDVLNIGTPTDGSVATAKIASGAVTDAKIASGISSSKLTGALPAIDGSALTSVVPEGPAFQVNLSSTWSVSNNSTTVIPFATEAYDTDSCYNTSNYRFTPNVAGYYLIHLQTRAVIVVNKQIAQSLAIRKNGSSYAAGQYDYNAGGNTDAMFITKTALVPMNGTTDHIDFTYYQYNYTTPGTYDVHANAEYTYATGHLALKL